MAARDSKNLALIRSNLLAAGSVFGYRAGTGEAVGG